MKQQTILRYAVAAMVVAAVGYGLYWSGLQQGKRSAQDAAPAGTGKKPLYWHDPMVPGQKFDHPGKSPFMDMQLVPVYSGEDSGGDPGGVAINPRVQQNLGLRTAPVTRGEAAPALSVVGNVAYNERDVTLVQARSNGYVERLYVKAPLDPVRKGQPLAELYVPDWIAAQEEFLSARRLRGPDMETVVDAARQRMRLAGMSEAQIQLVESSGSVHPRATIAAPADGVVTELAARQGMTLQAGATLFRIGGLGSVWVLAEIPEGAAGQVRPGAAVEASVAALPGSVFKGKVEALLPKVDTATRTLQARIVLANPGGRLAPGMFATLALAPADRRSALRVPSEAVIQTGTRSVVMLAQDGGRYVPRDVQTGAEADGMTEIRSGLVEGQKVVVSGQFLVDSEASLRATGTRAEDAPPVPPQGERR